MSNYSKNLLQACERAFSLAKGLLVLACALSAPFALANNELELIPDEGVIQEISLAESKVIISGYEYRVVPHADVKVRGNASSIAGLVVGMKVSFQYEEFVGFKAELSAVSEGFVIHQLEQMPDNVELLLH